MIAGANRSWLAYYAFGFGAHVSDPNGDPSCVVFMARAILHSLGNFAFGVHVKDPQAFVLRVARMEHLASAKPTRLERDVLPEKEWPYGPPSHHETCCMLFEGATDCDCKASDASDNEYGEGAWPTDVRAP